MPVSLFESTPAALTEMAGQVSLKVLLLGFAGLYDSVPMVPLEPRTIDYADEPLFWDSAFQQQLLMSIARAARDVEAAFGGNPQDIEGVYADGSLTIVQSRPQVL